MQKAAMETTLLTSPGDVTEQSHGGDNNILDLEIRVVHGGISYYISALIGY